MKNAGAMLRRFSVSGMLPDSMKNDFYLQDDIRSFSGLKLDLIHICFRNIKRCVLCPLSIKG